MADWDVVDVTPAGSNPWGVVNQQPAAMPRRPELDPNGSYLSRVGRAGMGVAQLVGTGIASLPHATASAAVDLSRRLTGGNLDVPMPAAVEALRVEPGQAAQELVGTVAAGPEAQAIGEGVRAIDRKLGEVSPTAQSIVHHTLGVGGDVAALAPIAQGARVGASGVRDFLTGAVPATAPEWAQAGFRNAVDRGVARTLAGPGGKDALTLHNQRVGNSVLAAEAGVPAGTPLSYQTLALAREPANAVYNRVAATMPPAPLDAAAMQRVTAAGSPTGLVTTSEAAQRQIQSIGAQLGQPMTGEAMVNNLRSLRQEGYRRVASEDVDQQMIGRAQLEMARAIEDHIARNLPANGPVSLDQFLQARVALAKNHTVEAALHGNDVDLNAIARAQRHDPELLSGGLRTAAEFANANPAVVGLGSRIYDPPSFGHDVMDVGLTQPGTWLPPATGAAARRVLTGPTERLAARGAERYTLDPRRFDPLPTPPPAPPPPAPPNPDVVPFEPPPAAGLSLADELGAGGAAPRPPGGAIPLADVLAAGVEQAPPAGLSLASELGVGGRPGEGIPFRRRMLENNASGESAASKEAIGRVRDERSAGVKRYAVDPDGNMTPLTGVDAVDAKAPKGSLIVKIDKDGKPEIVDRGGLPKAHADGLVKRALSRGGPSLGDALLMPGG